MERQKTSHGFVLLTRGLQSRSLLPHSLTPFNSCNSSNSSNSRPTPRATGFTLLELMLVVVIIGVLAAVVAPNLAGRSQEARIVAAEQTVSGTLATALELYEQDTGGYPSTQQGLEALIVPLPGVNDWRGPYLTSEAVPLDPWGRAYRYRYPNPDRPRFYDLVSAGPDGQFETEDDIVAFR